MEAQQDYLAFFRLAVEPFAPTADPACFYATAGHQACLRQIWRTVEARHGAALVMGGYGTGKTILLRKLAASLRGAGGYRSAIISAPMVSWTTFDLLAQILAQFGVSPSGETTADHTEALIADLVQHRGQSSTLIIDDAQNLNKRGQLELLRMLLNLELPRQKLLNMVLFAQPDWQQVLRAAPNFAQRLAVVCRLEPLQMEDVRALIQFRLQQAGVEPGRGPQFQEDAYRELYEAGGGVPRSIINLCRHALELAAEQRTWLIDSVLVQEAAQRTWLPGVETPVAPPAQADAPPVPARQQAPPVPPGEPETLQERPGAPQQPSAPARPIVAPRESAADDEAQPSREDRAAQLLLRARSRKGGRG